MEIFQYSFMQNAFIIGLVVAIICPMVGLFITLRRMSLIADALSHISLAGVAAGLISGVNPVLSASLWAVGGGLLIEYLRQRFHNYAELSIAIMLSIGVAMAAILLGIGNGLNANILSFLFGSIVLNNSTDVLVILIAGVAVLTLISLLHKELYLIAFDEQTADITGLPVSIINITFTVITALTIALAMRIVGILMVSSLMIIPVATALQLADSFRKSLYLSILFGVISVLVGLFTSFYLNLPPGGTIIMTAIMMLLTVLVAKSIQVQKVHIKVNNNR